MKKLKDYFKLQKEIFDYFGYVEDWNVIPLEDKTDAYWSIKPEHIKSDQYVYKNTLYTTDYLDKHLELVKHDWNWEEAGVGDYCYSFEIYRNRFLPKSIYEGKEYTMITVDTHVDGNKFLMIFDNSKKVDKNTNRKLKLENINPLDK